MFDRDKNNVRILIVQKTFDNLTTTLIQQGQRQHDSENIPCAWTTRYF